MAQRTDSFDLGRLGLSSGEGRRLDLEVRAEPLEFGGQTYEPERGGTAVILGVSRTTSGWSLRLRCHVRLDGPCMRCLESAGASVNVDAREIDQPGGGDDLSSPYVDGDELDLRGWVRDALALALPTQIVCREDCRGLCAVCGQNLNELPADHSHPREPDPRWAKLRELRLQ
jgi:uncharacterized protein